MRLRAPEGGLSGARPGKQPTSWTLMTLAPDTTPAQMPVMVNINLKLISHFLSFFICQILLNIVVNFPQQQKSEI